MHASSAAEARFRPAHRRAFSKLMMFLVCTILELSAHEWPPVPTGRIDESSEEAHEAAKPPAVASAASHLFHHTATFVDAASATEARLRPGILRPPSPDLSAAPHGDT